MTDKNSMSYWFPPLEDAGLPVPRTEIVGTWMLNDDLFSMLDGKKPSGVEAFERELRQPAMRIGYPLFLRTGHTSGKHRWHETCYVSSPALLMPNVVALVEESAMCGLPANVWAVRELLPTAPIFRCLAYKGMPVAREFRLFADQDGVDHVQPYWPTDAIRQGLPSVEDWERALDSMSHVSGKEFSLLCELALQAAQAVGSGAWSIDLLQDARGRWWITDMAEAARSFRWEHEHSSAMLATIQT